MSITFLGQIVSEEGITTDPTKVENICKLICTQRQRGDKEYIGTWKLLQAVHQELLCNNSHSARIVEKVCPLQAGQ